MKRNLYFFIILAIVIGTIWGVGLNRHFTAEAQTQAQNFWTGQTFWGFPYSWGANNYGYQNNWTGYSYGYQMPAMMWSPSAPSASFGSTTLYLTPTSGGFGMSYGGDGPGAIPYVPTVTPPNLGPPDIRRDDPATFEQKWGAYYIGYDRMAEVSYKYLYKKGIEESGYGPTAGYEYWGVPYPSYDPYSFTSEERYIPEGRTPIYTGIY